ncbi:MAG TPA: serine/threonine protein kinase [Pirellulales bacterium]|nr:serine/threonine protein kinase [Pirellulales bacterium]
MAIEQTLPQSTDELQHARDRSLRGTRPAIEVPGFDPVYRIGSGAYGEVWLAIERNTRRKVAIKFYTHRGGLDWSLLSREVEKLAFLFADRYVVQLIDVGWDANPPYYIMEFVEGGSLADRLHRGPIAVDEAVSLLHDIGVGLVHAHGKGVLHCDLTPGNVLIDQDGKPRLADFGQSRMSYEQTPALGTLFYMAPEQADLHAVPDARWDVYSMGALFYAMLTGSPPYRNAETLAIIAQATDLEGKLRKYAELLHTQPAPAEHRRVRGVDRELADIVSRALAIHPSKRFANPQAMLDALRRRAHRISRRPLLVLGAVGPAVLLLVIAGFAANAAWVSFERSEQALIQRSLESCRFAARFVAYNAAAQINRRWYTLEREANDSAFIATLQGAIGQPRDSDARQRLQNAIEFMRATHPELPAGHWFVMEAHGRILAASPPDAELIDRDMSYRDYFHGRGSDLEPGATGSAPIELPHRSHLYESIDHERRMAFSVPVWQDPNVDDREAIGVLALSAPLGRFAELHTIDDSTSQQMAVLVDDLDDSCRPPRRGAVLEHPHLEELLHSPGKICSQFYEDAAIVDRMQQLRKLRMLDANEAIEQQVDKLVATDDYHDPVGGPYEGRWLAAFEPVIVSNRPRQIRDTGLVVIVQQRFEGAVLPARQLVERIYHTGLVALVVVLVVISLLWVFVIVVLNEAPRLRRAQRRLAHALPLASAGDESTATTNSANSN